MPLVLALMACTTISPTLIMKIHTEPNSSTPMLALAGVAFVTKAFEFAPKTEKVDFGKFT